MTEKSSAESGSEGFASGVAASISEWFKRVGKDTLWGLGGGAIIGALFGAPAIGAGVGGIVGFIRGFVRHK